MLQKSTEFMDVHKTQMGGFLVLFGCLQLICAIVQNPKQLKSVKIAI